MQLGRVGSGWVDTCIVHASSLYFAVIAPSASALSCAYHVASLVTSAARVLSPNPKVDAMCFTCERTAVSVG